MKAIFILFDSLNRRYLPPYDSDCGVIAPNFQRLAEKTCQMNNAYVGSMPCIPARRELHTGRYNFLHREWGPIEPFDDSAIRILKKKGVYTHLVSDHLHYWEDGGANYHTQYNSWEIVRGQEGDHWKAEVKDPIIPEVVRIPQKHSGSGFTGLWRYDWINRNYIKKTEEFPQYQVFEKSMEFLNKNHDEENWLLHIETFDPHEPFYAPQEFLDLYPEEYAGKHYDWPRGQRIETDDEVNHVRRQYKALVSFCDRQLGRVLDFMDEKNMWDDTLLVVTTDHGILLGEHGWWSKNLMPYFNEIANIPFFMHHPSFKVGGEKRESLVQLIDIAPTLLTYFGAKPTEHMLGKDLSPVLRNDEKIRQYALYGAFSAHVNITDGTFTYMRGPSEETKNLINNYTLMPVHMNDLFSMDELKRSKLMEGFSFTKGCNVLQVPSFDKYDIAHFGNSFYDVVDDPSQQKPLIDHPEQERFITAMVELMKENEAPLEQYQRLELTEYLK